jgi:hypothetical protein
MSETTSQAEGTIERVIRRIFHHRLILLLAGKRWAVLTLAAGVPSIFLPLIFSG